MSSGTHQPQGTPRICQSAADEAARRAADEQDGDDGRRRRGWFGR